MTPQEIYQRALNFFFPKEKMQVKRPLTAYTYVDGPMFFIGQRIVQKMEKMGRPCKILWCYRTPEKQAELYAQGRFNDMPRVTDAPPYESAHQYYLACDFVHPSKYWEVKDDYWDDLAACVKLVGNELGVDLNHGYHWARRDAAHVQLREWRTMKEWVDHNAKLEFDPNGQVTEFRRPPTKQELAIMFEMVLPDVWKQRTKRRAGKPSN